MGPARQHPHVSGDWVAYALRYDRLPGRAVALRAEVTVHPDTPVVSHSLHPGFEFGVTLAGEHERTFPGLVLPTQTGDVWLTCAWELHGYRQTAKGPTVVWMVFTPEFLGEETLAGVPWLSLFAAPSAQRPRVNTPQLRARVLAIGREMQEEIGVRKPGWEGAVRLHLLRLLLALRREWEPPPTHLRAGVTPATAM